MKKAFLFFASLFLGALLFVWVVGKIGWQDVWVVILTFSVLKLLVIIVLTLIMFYIGVLRWREVLKSQGLFIGLPRLWNSYLAGFTLSFFVPMIFFGNEILRAYALRDAKNVSFAKRMASVIIDKILELAVYLIVIISGVVFFLLNAGTYPSFLLLILAGSLLFLGIVLFLLFKKKSMIRIFLSGREDNGIAEIEQEILDFFHFKNPFLFKGLLYSVLKSGAAIARAWVLILFLGKTIGILPVIGVVGFHYVALFVPIPAALGLHDVLQIFAFQSIGMSGSVGVGFALIVRVAEFLIALAGIGILVRLGIGMLAKMLFKKTMRLIQG